MQTYVADNPQYVHSGNYGVKFGNAYSLANMMQNIPTAIGAQYKLSFWFRNMTGLFPQDQGMQFYVNWNAETPASYSVMNVVGEVQSWTYEEYTVTATSSLTKLQFVFYNHPDWGALDDISLVPVPEPSTYIAGALLLLPFVLQSIRRLRNRKL